MGRNVTNLFLRIKKNYFGHFSKVFLIAKNRNGNALVYAVALAPVVMMTSYFTLQSVNKAYNKQTGVTMERGSIQAIANQINALVENQGSWRETVFDASNSSMSCLRSNGSICASLPASARMINLKSNAATFFTREDPLMSGKYMGFDRLGIPCDKYHPTSPDETCTYRVRLRWTPVCTTPCTSIKPVSEVVATFPPQKIEMEFYFSSSQDDLPNEIKVEMAETEILRGSDMRQVEVLCKAIRGQRTGAGSACRLAVTPKNCRSAHGRHMVDRVDPNGNVVCKNPVAIGTAVSQNCSSGNAMVGFKEDTFVCDVF